MSSGFVEQPYVSWGRVDREMHRVARPQHRQDLPALLDEAARSGGGVLGAGLGRSYGDSGLNPQGRLISGRALDRFIALDEQTGVLRAEGGASLDAILRLIVPKGWFLPTTPGTRFVTLAGAAANDVHGKNHHQAGSFGCHIRRMGLIRSDRGALELSPDENAELFFATLGGLGLTGFITWVEIQLVRVPSSHLEQETIPFSGLDGFFDLLEDSEARFEHVAAWIDCAASGRRLGRGVMFRAGWSRIGGYQAHAERPKLKVPIEAPSWALNPLTIRAFNTAYYQLQASKAGPGRATYASVFHPLDAIADWNRLYGPRGFFQHQFVVPTQIQREATREALTVIAASGQGSFLAVLKGLGARSSGGLIAFPRPGVSLALDFPNRGAATLALLARLDAIVADAGGRIYPAKDGRIDAAHFQAGYPRWAELEALRDPLFQSAFWRRVTS